VELGRSNPGGSLQIIGFVVRDGWLGRPEKREVLRSATLRECMRRLSHASTASISFWLNASPPVSSSRRHDRDSESWKPAATALSQKLLKAVDAWLKAPHTFAKVAHAQHFSFFTVCPASIADHEPMICKDPPGFAGPSSPAAQRRNSRVLRAHL